MIERPIFLVGSERSGTTLLRLMLDHHPRIAFLPEFEFAVTAVGDSGSLPDLAWFREWLGTRRDFLEYDFAIDPRLDYPGLVDSFLEQKRSRDRKPFVGATVHRHFHRLLHIWPGARFLHIVRDGRDVALSCMGMTWAGNAWCGPERWIEAERLWDRLAPELGSRACEIRYEELVEEPERVLSGICDFLGVGYDKAVFDYVENSQYETPRAELAYQWRQRARASDLRLIEARVADLLGERGYPPSGLPPLHVGAGRAAWLRFHDRWRRRWLRLRRFGVGLVAADVLSRRLGLTTWQRATRLRLNEIERRHLR